MRFKKNWQGYLLLGIMFLIFVGIPAYFLIMMATVPTMIVALMSGSGWLALVLMLAILVLAFILMGWLIFRFIKTNQFG